MSNILFIDNDYEAHYEILESIIVKYKELIGNIEIDTIYLSTKVQNSSFSNYISKKYIHIILGRPTAYTYYISATLYPKDYNAIKQNNIKTHFYISHRVDEIYNDAENIFYLTPLASKNVFKADILPYKESLQKPKEPIFIVPGDFGRRNISLLKKILSGNYERKFKIKIFGKNTIEDFNDIRVKKCINYDWTNYHREFLDCYCILPLITKASHPEYYTTTLTSSINYISGYNFKSIVDSDLNKIYDIPNAYVFNNEDDICIAFE